MADMNALRDRILQLAMDQRRSGYVTSTTNSLYDRLAGWYRERGEIVPISRTAFYRWFGTELALPSHQLLECVPGFATIFGVEEFELFAAARLLRPGLDAPLTIASAARQVRQASRLIARVLTEAAVPSSGEAIIADRILHHKLDYQISIWPVVRGHLRPLHLHSLIALRPLEPDHSKQRKATADIERMPLFERRDHIRHHIISDGIWRSFGMLWREVDAQWNLGKVPLTIELPIEERNRPSLDESAFPELQVSRILVLGPPWGHAELMAALLADALRFRQPRPALPRLSHPDPPRREAAVLQPTACRRRASSWSGRSARGLGSCRNWCPTSSSTGAGRSWSCCPTGHGCACKPPASSTNGSAGSTRRRPSSKTWRWNSTASDRSFALISMTPTSVLRRASRGPAWSTATLLQMRCAT